MSNLTVRILSALVLSTVCIAGMTLDTRSRWAVIAFFLTLGAWEWSRMLISKYGGAKVAPLAGAAVLLFTLADFPGLALPLEPWAWGLACASTVLFTVIGFRSSDIAVMAPWIYMHLFGIAYFGLYASALFDLPRAHAGLDGLLPFLMILILIVTADTGAYFTGRKFGKVKLAPTISGGKTREGAVGGAVLTMAMALALGPYFLGTPWAVNLGLGLLMAATAIVGDLFISILKRHTGTKDSSNLIPGHGGVLDRFDALFFSAPVAVFYLRLVAG
jgi:phosphatidate cytidylyltransferase